MYISWNDTKFSQVFLNALFLDVKRIFKRQVFGYLYGSYECTGIVEDAEQMYLMGGEL